MTVRDLLYPELQSPETGGPMWDRLDEQGYTTDQAILPASKPAKVDPRLGLHITDWDTAMFLDTGAPFDPKHIGLHRYPKPHVFSGNIRYSGDTGTCFVVIDHNHRTYQWKTVRDGMRNQVVYVQPGSKKDTLIVMGAPVTNTSVTSASIVPTYNTTPVALVPEKEDPLAGFDRYLEHDWDGYGAEPITSETADATRFFLEIMPRMFGDPDIAPGVDGTVGLQWVFRDKPLRKLFIDIGPGYTWGAYWRKASGETDTIKPERMTMRTYIDLEVFFRKLAT
ncbi:MAG: hypothetical protein K2Z80_37730 [Xanthobacteraceae bacterium]|nr:hypothetical protein [Xanthobacteraceae bacterium]